jgi:hypothetical protein
VVAESLKYCSPEETYKLKKLVYELIKVNNWMKNRVYRKSKQKNREPKQKIPEIRTIKIGLFLGKVPEIRNATHNFRSEKFLHHCVQRVSKPRKTYLVK